MSVAAADEEIGSDAEGPSSVSTGEGSEGSDLESMTGKGIKCLCSELLELKKSSDEDFQRNLYSNYSTFIRVLQEVGDVEREVMELSRHVSDQKRLVNDLMNFCSDYFCEGLLEVKNQNDLVDDDHFLGNQQTHSISILEKLDALSSEQRFEEVLNVLEKETQTLERINMEGDQISVENSSSHKSALSEWRTKLGDHLAAMAGHPRVTASELQKLLSLLCRLGEDYWANSLLIKFYHSRLVNHMDDLQSSKSLLNQMYIMDLAKVVFSVISQAAGSFVMLHGETCLYSSEFMVWATEEIKMFTHYFDLYVKSISEVNRGLCLAAECMKCALSFCSLLTSQRLALLPSVINSIQPCMEEVLQMHVNYLRKTINIFTATDTWILDKFLVSEITGEKSSLVGDEGKLEYCFLTNSGRKFIALTQAILEDISPFNILKMENLILRSLADLFNEYIKILERSMCSFGNHVEKNSPKISYAQMFSQHLSILVNSSTLVDYFFSIAKFIFEGSNISSDEQISENSKLSRKMEIEAWIFSIQDLANQLRGFFCQQFVNRYFSSAMCTPRTGSLSLESQMGNMALVASSYFPMPSSEFQVLFQQLRQLKKCGITNFVGADEDAENLLKDLIDTIVAMTSNNLRFWRDEDSSPFQHSIWRKQFVLDMHFLVEIARFGGYFSDRLMEASRSLVVHVTTKSDTSSAVADCAWATTAAQAAIHKLVEIEAIKLEPDENYIGTFEEDVDYVSAQSSGERDATGSVEFSDREVERFAERDIVRQQKVENSGITCLDGISIDFIDRMYHDKDSVSPPTCHVDLGYLEDGPSAGMELEMPTEILAESSAHRRNGYAAYVNELVIDGQTNLSIVESPDDKNHGIYSVKSPPTHGLATNYFSDNAIEAHFEAKPVPDETTSHLPHTKDEQDSAEKVTAAVAHSTYFFDSSTSTSEPLVHDNYGKQVTGMSKSPSECALEDYGFALDNDADTVKNRIMQVSIAGMAIQLPTNSMEQLDHVQPVSAVGELSESDTRSDLLSTREGFYSPPNMTRDAQKSRDEAKLAWPISSPSKFKVGREFSRSIKTGSTPGNVSKDPPQHSGEVRKESSNYPPERPRWH